MPSGTVRQLSLVVLDDTFAVCKLAPEAAIPAKVMTGGFSCVTRTSDELSLVCSESVVPEDVMSERGWRGLRVDGSMAFTEIGVLASLVAQLAEAGISVFAISTFDTDYLFVKSQDWDESLALLQETGHKIINAPAP